MSITSDDSTPLVMLGAGGHAKVLLSLAQAAGLNVCGVCDPELTQLGIGQWRGIKVLGNDDALDVLDPTAIGLINGIGQLVGSTARRGIFERLVAKGFRFPTLVHPAAWVDASAVLHEGVQVMAGAVIQPDTEIGPNSIINTHASVDHDCCIGAHVHIAPGATLCGSARIHDRAFIASGATVIQGLSVGEDAVVGAGSVLVRDLEARLIFLGPAALKKAGLSE